MKPPSYTIERRVYPGGKVEFYPKRNGRYYRSTPRGGMEDGWTSYAFGVFGWRECCQSLAEAESICREDWQRWIDSLPAMITSETPFDPEGV